MKDLKDLSHATADDLNNLYKKKEMDFMQFLNPTTIHRPLRTSFTKTLIFTFLCHLPLYAVEELSIIDVRRNIPLSDSDPIYKDFYIYNTAASSVVVNSVIEVYRKILIRDSTGVEALGELEIPVGQLKVIAKSKNLIVAREWGLLSRDEAPMLEQTGILIGDKLNLAKSFLDSGKKKSSKTK